MPKTERIRTRQTNEIIKLLASGNWDMPIRTLKRVLQRDSVTCLCPGLVQAGGPPDTSTGLVSSLPRPIGPFLLVIVCSLLVSAEGLTDS